MNKTTATTEKKNDDANALAPTHTAQKHENDQADALLDAYAAQNGHPTLIAVSEVRHARPTLEARMLDVCAQWAAGNDIPMPVECIELYRAVRHVRKLPARPSTIAKIEPINRANMERTTDIHKQTPLAHPAPASADEAKRLAANRDRFHAMMLQTLRRVTLTPKPLCAR